jgi:Flp pilus assembly protein TadD
MAASSATFAPMNPSTSASSVRLQSLAGYLHQDPDNAALLAEACDAAMACGRHEQAQLYIATAERLSLAGAEWQLRRAQLSIAQRDLPRARALLEQLRCSCGDHPVVVHDLAYVHLLQGDAAASRDLLQPWMGTGVAPADLPADQCGALQVLWLRACHRTGLLQQAWEWALAVDAMGKLQPQAAGVASLIALDLDQFESARTLAATALAADTGQVEALVARGSLALASGATAEATALLERALELNGEDGRTWSALGFASLLARKLPLARSQLERAVQAMPDHIHTWQALGWTRLLLNDGEGALLAFRTALRLDEEAADSHGALGLALLLVGHGAEAEHHLQTADRLAPDDSIGRHARAAAAGAGVACDETDPLLQRLLAQWRPRP